MKPHDGHSKDLDVSIDYPFTKETGEAHDGRFKPVTDRAPGPGVVVSLCDVRAADALRVEYDFVRDGWSVQQQKRTQWWPDEDLSVQWVEVAFCAAWAVNEDPSEDPEAP